MNSVLSIFHSEQIQSIFTLKVSFERIESIESTAQKEFQAAGGATHCLRL